MNGNPILHSRVHRLRSFEGSCFVKREDELGFGISGTKARKYLSLLPALLKESPDEVVITGSAYSNHVLSLSQLLIENGVKPVLFLLGDPGCKPRGNFLYTLMLSDPTNIHWVPRKAWTEVEKIAAAYAEERRKLGIRALVVPQGGNCPESLPGAMTLAADILRNGQELGIAFDHVFIDSGTGLTACALILGLEAIVHVIQVAGDREEFLDTLEKRRLELKAPSPTQFRLYTPTNAPKFGSVNRKVFQTIAELARSEGFLTDPVFTAKLFYEGRRIIDEAKLRGNILFVHSGGGLGMTGFQEELDKNRLIK